MTGERAYNMFAYLMPKNAPHFKCLQCIHVISVYPIELNLHQELTLVSLVISGRLHMFTPKSNFKRIHILFNFSMNISNAVD